MDSRIASISVNFILQFQSAFAGEWLDRIKVSAPGRVENLFQSAFAGEWLYRGKRLFGGGISFDGFNPLSLESGWIGPGFHAVRRNGALVSIRFRWRVVG